MLFTAACFYQSHHNSMPNPKQESKDLILRRRRTFARNFKQARKDAGLTQDDITNITGLTQPYLSDVENAKHTTSLDNAERLAAAVGQPLWKLLTPAKK
jgi:DNA-binding XRE family transcriptional regulator